ncbi:MAG TPA: transketolase C-terminal domain-containing protein [Gemmatimonadales bacterium]|nr:transketolase C-terminal domain-containing protein [Gemmatimonadales bacterium]
MIGIRLLSSSEFDRARGTGTPGPERLALVADMCRFNTLSAVKRAGSGHLGSSFSAMDIVVWLYFREMNTLGKGITHPDRDIYFSSKGHDVPGLYAVLHAGGVLSREQLLKLRRLGGLDGHPDVGIPGIEANSGSLGMGISKGKGMAWAKNRQGRGGRVFVLTGDGELQEGQNYEALLNAARQGVPQLAVIVDHNKLQTDKPVAEISDLGDIEARFRTYGWKVLRCDGHSWADLERVFGELRQPRDVPAIVIADTVKGRGVSFMEHPRALADGRGLYRWHAGAPDDESFAKASAELLARVREGFRHLGLGEPAVEDVVSEAAPSLGSGPREFVAEAYGQALVDLAARRTDIVVLDGDLSADCRVRGFESTYPERFIENGIAEQDMVSMAGGLARGGLLPVVNSFASFLASRANEQIYNNATERSKVIYVCHFGGLIPAGPGKSHQSVRDISLFGALPDCTILQPCNADETRQALEYLVERNEGVGVLRLAIGPSPRSIALPAEYALSPGRGVVLVEGGDTVVLAYGPVLLHEALVAAETMTERGSGLTVVNHPWLNRVDHRWLATLVAPYRRICVVDDHSPVGGLADRVARALADGGMLDGREFLALGVEGYPACGAPGEVLRYHGLEGTALADRLLEGTVAMSAGVVGRRAEHEYTLEAPQ